MSNVVASIQYSDVPGFPAGSVVDHIEVTVTGPGAPVIQDVAPGTPSVTFTNLAAGSYTITVEAVDASGAAFGSPVTGSFTIPTAGTVTLSLPSSVSTTVS